MNRIFYFTNDVTFFFAGRGEPVTNSERYYTLLFVDLEWAPRLKVGRFYYGCSLKNRENSLHLEASVVNN